MPTTAPHGFTLIEMTMVVALAASLIALETERRVLEGREKRRERFVEQVEHVRRAVAGFYRDRLQLSDTATALWPTDMDDLREAPHNGRDYLGAMDDDKSAFGEDFRLEPSEDETELLLLVEVGSEAEAELLAHRVGGFGNRAEESELQLPLLSKDDDTTDPYYLRSGALPLTGDLDANRHALRNVFEVRTQDLIVEGTQAILSDERAKQHPTPLVGKGQTLTAVQPLQYLKGGRPELGFSAAEVGRLHPELVRPHPSPGGDLLYLSYDGLLAVLWAEVQRLASKIEALEQQQRPSPAKQGTD